jgi:hypothetical protein
MDGERKKLKNFPPLTINIILCKLNVYSANAQIEWYIKNRTG